MPKHMQTASGSLPDGGAKSELKLLLKKIDGQYYRFLRRSIGIKASFYSRITNRDVWTQAGKPVPASEILNP